MKAFVAITLLAACVAAQTFDYQTGLKQELLKKELGLSSGGLWKNVFGGKNVDTLRDVYNVPTTYNYNTVNGVNTLTLEEIIRHPLFETYYNLPLFREHFNHPLFKLYLTTPYFQQYWTHPVFTTFFRNPYLFNKYIHPIVYKTVATGVYDRENVFGLNKNVFGDYKTESTFPSVNYNHVQYPHVLDKIFKTLVHKPEIEVKTDIKIETPVEDIFGDYKNVESKVLPVEVINTIRKPVDTVEDELIKNIILKKILLNKFYGKTTYPDIYNVDKYSNFVNKYENVYPRHLVDNIYQRDLINKYENVYPRDLVNKYESVLPEDYVTKYLNKYENIYPRDLVNKNVFPRNYFNKYESIVPRDLLTKYENVLPRNLLTKYENVLPRDLLTKYENVIPRELLTKYENVPRDIFNKIETETKLDNILKPITV